MSQTQAFLKDSLIYTIPGVLSRGVGLLLIPLYTRILSPGDYGVLDLFLIVGAFVGLTVALEISQGVARFYADSDNDADRRAYASSALWFTLFSYALFAGGALIGAAPLAQLITGDTHYETAFRLGVLYITGNGLFMFLQNQLRWELRSRDYAVVSIVMTLVTAVAAIICAYGLSWGLEGILAGMAIGIFCGGALAAFKLRRTFGPLIDRTKLREMLAFSLPLVPSGLCVFLSTYTDRLMINHFMTLEDVGLYALGFRVAGVAGLLMVGFQGALTPLVMKHHRDAQTPADLERIFRYFTAFALVIFLGASLFGREILLLAATPAYYGAYIVIPLLVPSILLAGMYIFAPGIFIAKKTHLVLWINLAAALCNVALNLVLIPLWGIVGAALATLIGNIVAFAAYMVSSQRFYYIAHNWQQIGLIAAFFALAAVLAVMIDTISVFALAVKIVIFAAALYGLDRFRMIDLREMTALVAGFIGKARPENVRD
ncbi:MAG: flippase [Alphaproteobacteria bacterium]